MIEGSVVFDRVGLPEGVSQTRQRQVHLIAPTTTRSSESPRVGLSARRAEGAIDVSRRRRHPFAAGGRDGELVFAG